MHRFNCMPSDVEDVCKKGSFSLAACNFSRNRVQCTTGITLRRVINVQNITQTHIRLGHIIQICITCFHYLDKRGESKI